MAINPINRSTTIRLMGLASGMDTDTIIQQTLRLQQMKIDSQFRTRTMFEWKQQALNSVKDQITEFRRSFLTTLGQNAMRLSSTYNSTVAKVTGKNSDAVTITTSTNSPVGSMKIGQVVSLAKATSVSTAGSASKNGEGFKLTDKLGDIKLVGDNIKFDNMGHANVKFWGTNIELSGLDTIEDINGKLHGGNQIVFDQTDYEGREFAKVQVNGKDLIIYRDEAYSTDPDTGIESPSNFFGIAIANKVNALPGGLNFDFDGKAGIRLNGVYIELDRGMTIDDMLKKVNGSSANVTMSYDRLSDKFTVEHKKNGDYSVETWGLGAFGIADGQTKNGSMAIVQINGEWFERDSNTIDYRGVKITLNYTTSASGPVGIDGKPTWSSDDDITVSLKRDADEPINKIKSFIEAYNNLIKKLEDLLSDKKTKTESQYKPLTDEEKSLMSEKQVDEWEAIAKKGVLRNDAGIQSLINSLQSALFDTVKEAGLSPYQIGIKTGWNEGLGYQIALDEEKLRTALENDPDIVAKLFMSGAAAEKYEDKGWLYRMEDIMMGYVNGSQQNSLTSLENSIKRSYEQMEKLQQKMYDEEERLYKKYAALETAMSKIQQQSDWFASMLGSLDSGRK